MGPHHHSGIVQTSSSLNWTANTHTAPNDTQRSNKTQHTMLLK
jgi:hypothetical protein